MSGETPAEIRPGDKVLVKAGRYEGRAGVVSKLLKDGGELAQVTFPGGAADYCHLSYLEKITDAAGEQKWPGEGERK